MQKGDKETWRQGDTEKVSASLPLPIPPSSLLLCSLAPLRLCHPATLFVYPFSSAASYSLQMLSASLLTTQMSEPSKVMPRGPAPTP